MHRAWQVHRDTVARPDGPQRWDRAYQLLLRWAAEASTTPAATTPQEEDNADRPLCAGLDQPPATDAHD